MSARVPIATLCLVGFPGANRALATLARTAGGTRHHALASTHAASPEVRFLVDHLRAAPPRVLLLGGWADVYETFVDAMAPLGTACGVYWTSSGGQTDMSGETAKLARVLAHPALRHRLFAAGDLARALGRERDGFAHLPVTIEPPRGVRPGARPARRTPVVSFFFPVREVRRKNVLNGLVAVAGATPRPVLWLNGLGEAPGYPQLLDALGVRFRDLGWMERRRYESAVARCDVGLQPSFAETYDYVAADHLIRGVPVVASRMVPVMEGLPAAVRRRMVADAADSPAALRDRLDDLLAHPAERRRLGALAERHVRAANARDVRIAQRLLARLTEEA